MNKKLGKAQSRHAEIQAVLRSRIEDGTYPLGALLPPEQSLCEELVASRFTVRQALSGLRTLGMIDARPGYGTFVTRKAPLETITHRLSSFEELLHYPAATMRKQLSTAKVKVTPELAHLLKARTGNSWILLKAMRVVRGSDAAICWLNAYIDPKFANVLDLPNPDGKSLLRQIEIAHGQFATEAEVEIFVSRIDTDMAEPLQCDVGDPALVILRRYRGRDGQTYLVTHSIHPENRFSLTIDLSKQSGEPS